VAVLAVLAASAGAEDGAGIYAAKCASCHGKDGKGNPAMAKIFKLDASALDLTDQETLGKKDEDLVSVTAKGKGKMPAYAGKLKDEEISAAISYLRGLAAGGKGKAAASAGGEAAALYASKCASCHGKDGKGNPAMAKIFKLEPSALVLAGSGKPREELVSAVSKGRGKMPAFAGKLKDQELSELTDYFLSLGGGKSGP